MPIVGFNFDKTLAERKAPVKKGMRAAHNITIEDVKEEPLNLGENAKKPGLKFSFEYKVDYQPDIGEIMIKGHILYLEDEKKIKEIVTNWKKNKKMSPELTASLINTAIMKSAIKALSLSQDVNLPPHLPIPTIARTPSKTQGKAEDYIG